MDNGDNGWFCGLDYNGGIVRVRLSSVDSVHVYRGLCEGAQMVTVTVVLRSGYREHLDVPTSEFDGFRRRVESS